jgi:hypothetical protein
VQALPVPDEQKVPSDTFLVHGSGQTRIGKVRGEFDSPEILWDELIRSRQVPE